MDTRSETDKADRDEIKQDIVDIVNYETDNNDSKLPRWAWMLIIVACVVVFVIVAAVGYYKFSPSKPSILNMKWLSQSSNHTQSTGSDEEWTHDKYTKAFQKIQNLIKAAEIEDNPDTDLILFLKRLFEKMQQSPYNAFHDYDGLNKALGVNWTKPIVDTTTLDPTSPALSQYPTFIAPKVNNEKGFKIVNKLLELFKAGNTSHSKLPEMNKLIKESENDKAQIEGKNVTKFLELIQKYKNDKEIIPFIYEYMNEMDKFSKECWLNLLTIFERIVKCMVQVRTDGDAKGRNSNAIKEKFEQIKSYSMKDEQSQINGIGGILANMGYEFPCGQLS